MITPTPNKAHTPVHTERKVHNMHSSESTGSNFESEWHTDIHVSGIQTYMCVNRYTTKSCHMCELIWTAKREGRRDRMRKSMCEGY